MVSALQLLPAALPWIALAFVLQSPIMPSPAALAMESPWWENYDTKDRYRCDSQGMLILERNDSQASIVMAGQRSTLFRDRRVDNGIRYSGDGVMLSLKGDELQIDLRGPMPALIHCQRTDDV